MADVVRFIRKNGRIIPIRAPSGAIRAAHVAGKASRVALAGAGAGAAGVGAYHVGRKTRTGIKTNKTLDLTGLGLSVASGAVAAATFSHGSKGLLGGHLAAHLIDVGGVAANVASVKGKGKIKARAIQASKQEARNFAVGNAIYGAGLLLSGRNRKAVANYASKIVAISKKALRIV